MSNCIVTTTINEPTEALIKFANTGWDMIIVGDMKTPHDIYLEFTKKYPHVTYLTPQKQDRDHHMLSETIGWNCIQRRNIGLVEAYNKNYEVIAMIDDDNIPFENWGKDLLIGKSITVTSYKTDQKVFDPLMAIGLPELWHRGYPIQLLNKRDYIKDEQTVSVEVQADLWDGAPDIDAICRVSHPEDYSMYVKPTFTSNALCPFNSQNTFISRKALEHYFLFPHIGRMDDIWGGYILQEYMPNSVVYCKPSVIQKRNTHDIVSDLKAEMFGYEHTIELVHDLYYWTKYLPKESLEFVKEYTKSLHV